MYVIYLCATTCNKCYSSIIHLFIIFRPLIHSQYLKQNVNKHHTQIILKQLATLKGLPHCCCDPDWRPSPLTARGGRSGCGRAGPRGRRRPHHTTCRGRVPGPRGGSPSGDTQGRTRSWPRSAGCWTTPTASRPGRLLP